MRSQSASGAAPAYSLETSITTWCNAPRRRRELVPVLGDDGERPDLVAQRVREVVDLRSGRIRPARRRS